MISSPYETSVAPFTSVYDLDYSIVSFIAEEKDLYNLLLASKSTKQLVENAHRVRIKAFHLMTLLSHFSTQKCSLIHKSEQNHSNRKIHKASIEKYKYDLRNTASDSPIMRKIFLDFKEDIIDALSQMPDDSLAKLSLPAFLQTIPATSEISQSSQIDFSFHDVIALAKIREAGYVSCEISKILITQKKAEGVSEFVERLYDYDIPDCQKVEVSIPVHISTTGSAAWKGEELPRKIMGIVMRVDEFLPAKLFLGKKEGDAVFFTLGEKENVRQVRLICHGQSHLKENFEITFQKVLNSEPYFFEEDFYSPNLSKSLQQKILEETRQLHTRMIEEPSKNAYGA